MTMNIINNPVNKVNNISCFWDPDKGDLECFISRQGKYHKLRGLPEDCSFSQFQLHPGDTDQPSLETIWSNFLRYPPEGDLLVLPFKGSAPFLPKNFIYCDLLFGRGFSGIIPFISDYTPDRYLMFFSFNLPDSWKLKPFANTIAVERYDLADRHDRADRLPDRKKPSQPPFPSPGQPEPKKVPTDKKADVIRFPKPEEPKGKSKKPIKAPKDLLDYHKDPGLKKSESSCLNSAYRASIYGHSSKLYFWHSKIHRLGRWYFLGVNHLAYMTGYSDRTVRDALKGLREKVIIKRVHHGGPGRGNDIYELLFDLRHFFALKRKPKS